MTGRSGDPAVAGSAFNPNLTITFAESGGITAADLGLFAVTPNVQLMLASGVGAGGAQANPVLGDNGNLPGAADLMGVRANKTGMFALEDVNLFNILCIPRG